jgi:hypothetical protein
MRTILAKYVRECGQASPLSLTVRSTCIIYVCQILTRRVIVTFDESSSQGQVAMVIYEWKDVKYLGAITSTTDDSLPVSNPHNMTCRRTQQLYPQQKTYVCTTDAVRVGLCAYDNVGKFIFFSDDGTAANQTTFWTASVALNQTRGASSDSSGLWDSPDGNPTLPADNHTSPWRSRELHHSLRQTNDLNPSPYGTVAYTQPIQYQVRKKGYYCVGKSKLYYSISPGLLLLQLLCPLLYRIPLPARHLQMSRLTLHTTVSFFSGILLMDSFLPPTIPKLM